jgi:hypothetical protein
MTVNFCKKNDHTFWVKFTDCLKSVKFLDRQLEKIELKSLVRQMTRSEDDTNRS